MSLVAPTPGSARGCAGGLTAQRPGARRRAVAAHFGVKSDSLSQMGPLRAATRFGVARFTRLNGAVRPADRNPHQTAKQQHRDRLSKNISHRPLRLQVGTLRPSSIARTVPVNRYIIDPMGVGCATSGFLGLRGAGIGGNQNNSGDGNDNQPRHCVSKQIFKCHLGLRAETPLAERVGYVRL